MRNVSSLSSKLRPSFWNPRNFQDPNYQPNLGLARAEGLKAGIESVKDQVKSGDRHLLLTIDAQKDFGDNGRLPVKGAFDDCERLGERIITGVIERHYTDFLLTLDKHPPFHISNALWWRGTEDGAVPDPKFPISMTLIDPDAAVFKGSDGKTYRPVTMRGHTVKYGQHLEATGQGVIWVFADHCREGTDGIQLLAPIAELVEWAAAARNIQPVYLSKGMLAEVDFFGPFRPCMDVPGNPNGSWQTYYLDKIAECKTTDITGEAEDFCVNNGTRQVIEYYGQKPDVLKTIRFVKDCTSAIFPGGPLQQGLHDVMKTNKIPLITHDQF